MNKISFTAILRKAIFLFCFVIALSIDLFAKEIVPMNTRLQTNNTTTVTIGQPSATSSISIAVPGGSFTDLAINNLLTFGYDQNSIKYYPSGSNIKVKVYVQQWDKNNNLLAPFIKYLNVKYHPADTSQYIDKSVFLFHNAYKVQLTVDSIYVNGISQSTLSPNFYVETEISGERVYNFATNSNTQLSFTSLDTLDLDCDGVMDQMVISWNPIIGAEEFQLEWTSINDYGTALNTYLSPSATIFNFKNNSTRISTTANSYAVSNLFEHGYVLFRVRAIGRDLVNTDAIITGVWNSTISGGAVSAYSSANANSVVFINREHELGKNWQVTSTFAEEGKKKEVASYFDGSLRNRQTVTQLNSDKNTLVGQTIYDHQGRAAVNVLPTPVKTVSCAITGAENSIKYYPKYNRSATDSSKSYTRLNFDLDASFSSCAITTDSMSNFYGSSNYYSPYNPNKQGYNAYIPDANLYPFTQVEYTPDNTGRIRKQGGVGKIFQLGGNHETKYLYGQPNQIELDRMFASEAGDASHYKKNIVLDANGQASITYINLEGKTIATALAGDTVTNAISLKSGRQLADTLSIDVFDKDANGYSNLNTVNVLGNGIEFNSQILVAYTSNYTFNYNIQVDTLFDACLKPNVCFNCVYDLDIQLLDECGQNLALVPSGPSMVPISRHEGKFTPGPGGTILFNVNCTAPTLYQDSLKFSTLLTPGNYSLMKRLTINQNAVNYYVASYLDTTYNKCVKTLDNFITDALSTLDTSNCYITCDACVNSLGDRDDYVSSGKGTALKYDFLYAECVEPCTPVSQCETSLQMMLSDVSPTGQYAQYDSLSFSALAFPLSILNNDTVQNKLPNHTIANWRNPVITLNGNTYYHYVSTYGDIATIDVHRNLSGQWTPALKDTNIVVTDTSGTYSYPENLANLSDFIHNFETTWAKSLVQYHPEYCYYKTCIEYQHKDSIKDVFTSEGFDQVLNSVTTFSQAVSLGFINANYGVIGPILTNTNVPDYSPRLNDWFSFPTGTVTPYDPFVVYGTQNHYNGYGNQLKNQFNHYVTYNSVNYSMLEMAAYSARCGNLIGMTPTPNCFGFGEDYYPANPFAPINDSIRNLEWRILKGMYIGAKQTLINRRYDSLAIFSCGEYNDCIGNTNFNPTNNNFSSQFFVNSDQPCYINKFILYIDKEKRFPVNLTNFNITASSNNAAYQLYQLTGQCPVTQAFQNLLSGIAAGDSLRFDNNLLNNGQYSGFYMATQGAFDPNPPTSYPPITNSYRSWHVIDTLSNTLHADFVNPVTNFSCAISINKGAVPYWRQIKGFTNLLPTSGFTAVQTFSAMAKLVLKSISGFYDSTVYKPVSGTLGNCFNIASCNFNTNQQPTAMATDLNILMSALASNSQLLSSTPVNLQTTVYQPLLTPVILNQLGTPNNNMVWMYDAVNYIFYLYDNTNPSTKLQFEILPAYPTAAVLGSITSVQDIGPYGNSTNITQVAGYDVSNAQVATLIIQASKITPAGPAVIGMNNNLPAIPSASCSGNNYAITNQLVPLLNDVLINQFVPTGTVNIGVSPYFTNQLQVLLPGASGAPFTYNAYNYSANTLHNDSLLISIPGCKLKIYTKKHGNAAFSLSNLAAINSFGYSGLTLFGPQDANGNYHQFYLPVLYTSSTTSVNACNVAATITNYLHDTIYGSTCLPLKICPTCTNGLTTNSSFVSANNSMGSCDTTVATPPPGSPPPPPISHNDCVQQLIDAAAWSATEAYNDYVDSITTYIANKYRLHCLGALENLHESYKDKQYHYTLYFYDQAGNLTKTIPPEGVNLLAIKSSSDPLELKIIADRTAKKRSVFTQHRMATQYEYNSLNQLTRQFMPDHDNMNIFETSLSSGLNTALVVTGVQFVTTSKGYLSGYVDMGSGLKRGYAYVSNDGGHTWVRLQGMVASDLRKVQMVTATTGYAVGNEGTIIKTTDGGQNWDMLNTFANNITNPFTGLHFTDSIHGVFIGDKSTLLTTTDGGLTFNSSITATPPFALGDSLTSVSHDGTNYILSVLRRGTSPINDFGVLYSSTTGNSWAVDSLRANNLLGVCIYRGGGSYAVGNNGLLLHKPATQSNWYVVPTSINKPFKSVFFLNRSEGIALIDSASGYNQLFRTSDAGKTWTLLGSHGLFYNQIRPYIITPAGAKLVGVGKNGLVSRIIMNHNTPFGVIQLNSPSSSANITACWGSEFTDNSPLQSYAWLLLGDDAGKLHYTYNGADPTPNWSTTTFTFTGAFAAIITNTNPVTQIEAYQGSTTVTTTAGYGVGRSLSASVLTSTGSVYYFYKNASATNTFVTDVVTGVSGISNLAYDKSVNNTGKTVYAFSNTGAALYKATYNITGPTTSMASAGAVNGSFLNINALYADSNQLAAVGNNGIIGYIANLSPAAPTWANQANRVMALPINALAYNTAATKAYGVGNNGLFVQRTTPGQWQILSNSLTKQLNTIAFTSASDGVVAGNNGVVLTYNITGSNLTASGLTVLTPNNLNQVSVSGTKSYITGANGTILYSSNPTPSYSLVPTTLTSHINAISFIPGSGGNAIAVGDKALVNLMTGTTRVNIKNVFTPGLNSINSINGIELYAAGNNYTLRRSLDGGLNWSVILPPASSILAGYNFNKILMQSAGTAYVAGNQGFLGKTSSSNVVNALTLTGSNNAYSGSFSTSTAYNFADLKLTSNNSLYIVGDDGTNGVAINYNLAPNNWFYIASSIANTPLKALWRFANNGFATCGANGYFGYFNGTLPGSNAATIPAGPWALPAVYNTSTFNAIYFHDDYTGYLVSNKGDFLKTTLTQANPLTLQIQSINWDAQSVNDKLLGQTDTTKMDIRALAFSDRYYGFMGGAYNNLAQPTVQAGYARIIHDESFYFSSRFWYDRLGRMTMSQNSKQYSKVPKALSYTLYDAIGRITEVGELAMQDAAYTLNSVFGEYINTYYNPMVVNDTALASFIKHNPRTEVTHTYYDTIAYTGLPMAQNNLRKRVSSVMYEDVYDGNLNTYNHATHYTYDVHGNVSTLLQDNPSLTLIGQQYKKLDYEYDLISEKVNNVYYQKNQADAFAHHYEYDADNRLTQVFTSRYPKAKWAGYKDATWDMDAKYFYYAHGPLARVELGDNKIQGEDYAYTLQGWIKGVNSDVLNPQNDIGKDGLNLPGNLNQAFARDAYGYSLTYYNNDYNAIGNNWKTDSVHRFTATQYGTSGSSDVKNNRYNLYNGNIGAMVTSITNPGNKVGMPQASAYKYDQLNRIVQARSFQAIAGAYNSWKTENPTKPAYYNGFDYDANGNILKQVRMNGMGTAIDSLTYRYAHDNSNQLYQNRLYSVNDKVSASRYADDIDDQGAFDSLLTHVNLYNNYSYDKIGQLQKDSAEQIKKIDWTVYGKIKSITRYPSSTKQNLSFDYDATGNRIAKHVYTSANVWQSSTYYTRDAQGNIMTTYKKQAQGPNLNFRIQEHDIYGSKRMGVSVDSLQLIGLTLDSVNYMRTLGQKEYELANHLGNVLTVVSDRKIAQAPQTNLNIYSSVAQARTAIDSLGGFKVQPVAINGGNTFNIKTKVGQNYNAKFYLRLNNTTVTDNLLMDYPGSPANSLPANGYYNINFTATDTLSDLKVYYAAGANVPNHHFSIDSLKVLSLNLTNDTIRAYTADLASVTDYYAFGSPIKERQFNNGNYRYGFNSQEKDDEIAGTGNITTAMFWEYDTRLGRRWNLDPKPTVGISDYSCFNNNPILLNDVNGDKAREDGDPKKGKGKGTLTLDYNPVDLTETSGGAIFTHQNNFTYLPSLSKPASLLTNTGYSEPSSYSSAELRVQNLLFGKLSTSVDGVLSLTRVKGDLANGNTGTHVHGGNGWGTLGIGAKIGLNYEAFRGISLSASGSLTGGRTWSDYGPNASSGPLNISGLSSSKKNGVKEYQNWTAHGSGATGTFQLGVTLTPKIWNPKSNEILSLTISYISIVHHLNIDKYSYTDPAGAATGQYGGNSANFKGENRLNVTLSVDLTKGH